MVSLLSRLHEQRKIPQLCLAAQPCPNGLLWSNQGLEHTAFCCDTEGRVYFAVQRPGFVEIIHAGSIGQLLHRMTEHAFLVDSYNADIIDLEIICPVKIIIQRWLDGIESMIN